MLWIVFIGAVGVSVCVASPNNNQRDDYDFGFNAGSHFRTENKGADGLTRGEYGFRTPDGCMHVVTYEADERGGYRVLGSNKRGCGRAGSRPPKVPLTPTTRRPITTRPTTTTRRPFTTRPITTTTTTTTTTRRPFSSFTRPTTTTTPRPRDPFQVPAVTFVDNAIADAPRPSPGDSLGRQLRIPSQINEISPPTTTTTRRPTTTRPADEPLYTFGFTTPTHGHTESGLPNGGKQGEYYWDAPDGWRRIVTYVANERGFFPKMTRVRIPTTTPKPPPETEGEGQGQGGTGAGGEDDAQGKELAGELPQPAGGCPYYFYYNTRINYHWERCYENHTKVGEYGELAPDGYQHVNSYYADITGYHPRITKTPMTEEQKNTVAEWQAGVFIVPKPDEERRATEKRFWRGWRRTEIRSTTRCDDLPNRHFSLRLAIFTIPPTPTQPAGICFHGLTYSNPCPMSDFSWESIRSDHQIGRKT